MMKWHIVILSPEMKGLQVASPIAIVLPNSFSRHVHLHFGPFNPQCISVQCNTVLRSADMFITVQCISGQRREVQKSAVQCTTVQCTAVQFSAVQFSGLQ